MFILTNIKLLVFAQLAYIDRVACVTASACIKSSAMVVISENIKKRLLDPGFRARLLEYTSDRYKIDLKAKPVDIPQASFRKLAID